jgi:hypothetical protein
MQLIKICHFFSKAFLLIQKQKREMTNLSIFNIFYSRAVTSYYFAGG